MFAFRVQFCNSQQELAVDIRDYNRKAWDKYVDGGQSEWTKPVSP